MAACCWQQLVKLPPIPGSWLTAGFCCTPPENTLANFRACLELRLGFEFDVARTQDGHLICMHDDTVDRTTDGSGEVSKLTLAEIQRLDAGSWFGRKFAGERVPTVEQVLKLVAEHRERDVLIAVDLKAADVERKVVELAAEAQVLHRLLFIGRTITEPAVREHLKAVSSHAQTAAVANTAEEFAQAMEAAHADQVYFRYVPPNEQITAAHQAGKLTFIAGTTVSGNVPENWKRASQAGIDAILTDYPLELAAFIRQARTNN